MYVNFSLNILVSECSCARKEDICKVASESCEKYDSEVNFPPRGDVF